MLQTVTERREEQDERERTERRGKKSEVENKGIHHMIRTTTGGNMFVYDEKRTQSDPMIRSGGKKNSIKVKNKVQVNFFFFRKER